MYASLFKTRGKDNEKLKPDVDGYFRIEESAFKGDAAFDSFIVGDLLIFGHSYLNTCNLHYMLDGVFMYPALLIAFKMGGGLEIGLGQSFSSSLKTLFQNEGILVSLLFVFGFFQVFRPLATHILVFKGQKVFEPNKFGFLSIIFFAPVFICFIGYPLIAGFKVLVINYTTILALGFNFLAYHTICDAEYAYRNNQTKDILLSSLTPLNLPKGVRGVHKVFRNKYNFNE